MKYLLLIPLLSCHPRLDAYSGKHVFKKGHPQTVIHDRDTMRSDGKTFVWVRGTDTLGYYEFKTVNK